MALCINPDLLAKMVGEQKRYGGLAGVPHFPPKAKRVIYLFMAGGPSQIDLLDYKPSLEKLHNTELPDSIRMGQRITGMTCGQKNFPVRKTDFQIRPARQGRYVGQRIVAQHREHCGRHRSGQNGQHRGHQSRSRRSRSFKLVSSSPGAPARVRG